MTHLRGFCGGEGRPSAGLWVVVARGLAGKPGEMGPEQGLSHGLMDS